MIVRREYIFFILFVAISCVKDTKLMRFLDRMHDVLFFSPNSFIKNSKKHNCAESAIQKILFIPPSVAEEMSPLMIDYVNIILQISGSDINMLSDQQKDFLGDCVKHLLDMMEEVKRHPGNNLFVDWFLK